MSINWVMLSADAFTPLPHEQRLWTSPPRTALTLHSLNKYPGREPFSISSSTGTLYLTTKRVIYLPATSSPTLESFSVPILRAHDSHVTAPFFGPNTWVASVQPIFNGGIPPHHTALELKVTFKDGGAYDFHNNFVHLKERLMHARENITGESRADAGDYGAVNLEQLPAYEESGLAASTSQQLSEGQNRAHSSGNLDGERISEAAPNAAPPTEPPPGYEEAQRDHVVEALERNMRNHDAR